MTQATTVEFPGGTAGMGWVRGVQMKRDTAPEGITGRTGEGPSARGSHGRSGRRPAAPRVPLCRPDTQQDGRGWRAAVQEGLSGAPAGGCAPRGIREAGA